MPSSAESLDSVTQQGSESPLAFPGSETQQKRRRRRRLIISGISALAVLLGITAVLYFSPLLVVRSMVFSGGELVDDRRAEELLGELYATPIAQVSDADVYRLLSEDPAVENAHLRIELPSTVHIEITEYEPVVQLRDNDQLQYYNSEGTLISTFPADEEPADDAFATPQISSAEILDDDAVFSAITQALGELPDSAREQLGSVSAESVDSITLELGDGREVLWGSAENGQQKAQVLEAVLNSTDPAFTEVDLIDISTPASPVTSSAD